MRRMKVYNTHCRVRKRNVIVFPAGVEVSV